MKTVALVDSASQMSGVEFSTLYLVRQLDRTRWTPLVVCPSEGDLPERCRAAGVETAIVPRPRFYSTSARVGGVTVLNPLAMAAGAGVLIEAARRLARFLRVRRPDLVVTKGLLAQFYGGLAARWAGIPCVWHVQDRVSARAGPLFPWLLSLSGRALARQAIADAETIASQLQTWLPRKRIHVIWNGVDTEEFSPRVDGAAVRAEWHAGHEDILIGTIGRLTPWKGQAMLLHALAALAPEFPMARAVLVGSALFDTDAYARELQAESAQLGLTERVVFAGFRWDMPQVLSALDIVAHTALEKDSTPLAVVSALAAGKPVVCAAVDGTTQLFSGGENGILFAPGDVAGLTAGLRALLADPERRARMGAAARVMAVRDLGLEQFAQRCEEVFLQVLG